MSETGTVDSKPGRSRVGAVALWAMQVATAAMLINAAVAKLTGNTEYAAAFATLGFGDWFMYVIGVLEVLGGVGLLLPRLAGLAAAALAVMMAGAVVSEIAVMKGNPAPALSILFTVMLIAWVRRAEIAGFIRAVR